MDKKGFTKDMTFLDLIWLENVQAEIDLTILTLQIQQQSLT